MPLIESSLRVHALRLYPGDEILSSLRQFVKEKDLRAPFILSCVGSVATATLRMANATASNCNQILTLSEKYEIVSLVGTLNPDAHLHVCLSDAEGRVVGGHVMGGLQVFTTVEVIIGEAPELHFTREMDENTGFPELVVNKRTQRE